MPKIVPKKDIARNIPNIEVKQAWAINERDIKIQEAPPVNGQSVVESRDHLGKVSGINHANVHKKSRTHKSHPIQSWLKNPSIEELVSGNLKPNQIKKTKLNFTIDQGFSWIIALSYFLWCFIIRGTCMTYGILYLQLQEVFQASNITELSHLPTIFSLCMCIMSPLAVYLSSNVTSYYLAFTGAFIVTVGQIIGAFAPSIGIILFGSGALSGVGSAFIEAVVVRNLTCYFKSKRDIALSIGFAGGSFGAVTLPYVFEYVHDRYFARGSLFILASLWVHVFVVCALQRPIPKMLTKSNVISPSLLSAHHAKDVSSVSKSVENCSTPQGNIELFMASNINISEGKGMSLPKACVKQKLDNSSLSCTIPSQNYLIRSTNSIVSSQYVTRNVGNVSILKTRRILLSIYFVLFFISFVGSSLTFYVPLLASDWTDGESDITYISASLVGAGEFISAVFITYLLYRHQERKVFAVFIGNIFLGMYNNIIVITYCRMQGKGVSSKPTPWGSRPDRPSL